MTFNKFYRQSIHQRRLNINRFLGSCAEFPILEEARADQMIENYLYNFNLPMGILPNIQVNGKKYVVPMVTEEPSVIAAASNGAKYLGNIQAKTNRKTIRGQIILTGLSEEALKLSLAKNSNKWLAFAKNVAYRMVERGGGPLSIDYANFFGDNIQYHSYYLLFDPCEAMGANALNTVLEELSAEIIKDTGAELLMAILSNYNPQSFVTVEAVIPINSLHQNCEKAHHLAHKIAMASEYAQLDPYRATTHNKGIMNGVDAVLLATGNDWRAAEASIHAFASRLGMYQGLSRWIYDQKKQSLKGYLDLPLPVATVGGTLSIHPMAQWSLDLLGRPTANELAKIIASVGLAQNFAALKALVSEGIQKGHMGLQARSLAIQVGAEGEEIEKLVNDLRGLDHFNSQTAKNLLDKIRNS